MKKNNGLYVHIPFCGALCHYCDFVKFVYIKKWIKPYLKQVQRDLVFFNVSKELKTIYVGGGTPSSLSVPELKILLTTLAPYAKHVKEYTFEANIESITRAKLLLLQSFGVNRLSIGVQSTCDERLKTLNRQHTYAQIKHKISLVKSCGFTNFSVDLIYGLPEQSEDELKQDVINVLKLNPPHISTYALGIEKNTVAFIRNWPTITDELSRTMYDQILVTLRENGYVRYEVSNFAKKGFESVHNKLYWQNKHYYAVGFGASGYIEDKRYKITGSFSKYLKGFPTIEEEIITPEFYNEEYLFLNLRLKKGFSLHDYEMRTGNSFTSKYASQINELMQQKLIVITKNRVYATDEGIMLLDYVIRKLI